MRDIAGKIRDCFVEDGYDVVYFRVNVERSIIEGKVTGDSGALYVRVSPDVIKVWDGVLSDEKERGAFAWGMREAWMSPTALKPGNVVRDVPEGSEDRVRLVVAEKPLHYQGGFYFVKACMIVVSLLTANGVLGIL